MIYLLTIKLKKKRSKVIKIYPRVKGKKVENNRLKIVFSRDRLVARVQELYTRGRSISLYSTEANDAEISQFANQFDGFIKAADQTDSLTN